MAQVMQHRRDYVQVEPPLPATTAPRAIGSAVAGSDGSSAGVVPVLLGKAGQQAPVVGETGQVYSHQVRGDQWVGGGEGGHTTDLWF